MVPGAMALTRTGASSTASPAVMAWTAALVAATASMPGAGFSAVAPDVNRNDPSEGRSRSSGGSRDLIVASGSGVSAENGTPTPGLTTRGPRRPPHRWNIGPHRTGPMFHRYGPLLRR